MKKKKINKNSKDGYSLKAGIGTTVIVVGLIIIFLLINSIIPFNRYDMRELMRNSFPLYIFLSSSLTVVSIYLMYIYLKDYLELRSRFTLGILFAIISFFLFAITSNPLLHAVLGIRENMGIFSFIPMIFAIISLAVLAWISSK